MDSSLAGARMLEWLAVYQNSVELANKLIEVTKVFTQVAYDQEDYYHSVQWLEESVRLFRGTGSKWSPENEGTLHDALDHLAFSHFMVGDRNGALVPRLMGAVTLKSLSRIRQETSHMLSVSPRSYCIPVRRFH